MELDKKHIEQLRMAELDLLRVFMSVCDELGLKYFIVQGTLLGAVRHGGFIPWDDDIDVGMLRKDYDILMSKGQTLLPPGYFLQTHESDPGYIHGFGKLRNSNTAFVETTCQYRKMNHGIFIDIFPFDFYPDSRLKRCVFELKKFFLRYRVQDLLNIPSNRVSTVRGLVKQIIGFISRIIYPSAEAAADEQSRIYKSFAEGSTVISNGSPWASRERVPIEWVQLVTKLSFEGIEVSAPLKYHEYLAAVYGDYMTLPPEEERVPHHYISYIDFERAFEPDSNP